MTLPEQIEYINKIKDKVSECENYNFIVKNQFHYLIFDKKANLPLVEFKCYLKDSFELYIFNYNTANSISCSLEAFLCNYFYDMINPTPEEKVMWKLQFGFDWYF